MQTFLTPPTSTDLTTVTALREELRSQTEENDPRLKRAIGRASRAIESYLRYELPRAKVVEAVSAGVGMSELRVTRNPLVAVYPPIVRSFKGTTQDFTDFRISDSKYGFIYREDGWPSTFAFGRSMDALADVVMPVEHPAYSVTYTGGFFLPGDDYASNTLSFAAGDSSINDSAGLLPEVLPGDLIRIEGSGSNNWTAVVVSRTVSKIVVGRAVTTEAAPSNPDTLVRLVVRSLPDDIEGVCLELASVIWKREPRDPTVTSKTVGPLTLSSRASKDAKLLSDDMKSQLRAWRHWA